MQAILNVKSSEVDERLKINSFELEEFDSQLSLEEIMREFGEIGYDEKFLSDLKIGFETSEQTKR